MDKDKAIEAARALVVKIEMAYPNNTLPEYKALKEALEDKPSREKVIKHLQSITGDFEHEEINGEDLEIFKEAIELLKQPTIQWLENKEMCDRIWDIMNEYDNAEGCLAVISDYLGKIKHTEIKESNNANKR